MTYALGGEDLAAVDAPLGLPLPERRAGARGAVDEAAAVRCAEGEVEEEEAAALREEGAGRSAAKDGLSWGAGEGAMATAVLMVMVVILVSWEGTEMGIWVFRACTAKASKVFQTFDGGLERARRLSR